MRHARVILRWQALPPIFVAKMTIVNSRS